MCPELFAERDYGMLSCLGSRSQGLEVQQWGGGGRNAHPYSFCVSLHVVATLLNRACANTAKTVQVP